MLVHLKSPLLPRTPLYLAMNIFLKQQKYQLNLLFIILNQNLHIQAEYISSGNAKYLPKKSVGQFEHYSFALLKQ